MAPLRKIWLMMGTPTGKRLAPFLAEMVAVLERFGELDITSGIRDKLATMSATTIDRRLAPDRKKAQLEWHWRRKLRSPFDSRMKTWVEPGYDLPGRINVDLVDHGAGSTEDFALTLIGTDIATGWTQSCVVRSNAPTWALSSIRRIIEAFPFPILGIRLDKGSFLNDWLPSYDASNESVGSDASVMSLYLENGGHSAVRQLVYSAPREAGIEFGPRDEYYTQQCLMVNYFSPWQRLVSKQRYRTTIIRRYDVAATPHQRALSNPLVPKNTRDALAYEYRNLNPAEVRRRINSLASMVRAL